MTALATLRRPVGLPALVAAALFACAAAGADLIASDLPLAASVDGHVYLLPCVTRPASLADDDQRSLSARAAWTVPTLVQFGPYESGRGAYVVAPLHAPSLEHLAGTDDRGRDVAARLVHGTRTALVVGGLAVALFLLVG